jgi:serine/threonine protein kinase
MMHFKAEDFTLTKKIGQGGNNQVFLAEKSGHTYILRLQLKGQKHAKDRYVERRKFFSAMTEQCRSYFMRELGYILGFKHEGKTYFVTVVEYLKDYYSLDTYTLCIFKHKPLIREAQLAKLFLYIAEAVQCLHHHDLLHKDLKLTNVMFDGRNLKIIDLDTICKVGWKEKHACNESNATTTVRAPDAKIKGENYEERITNYDSTLKPGEIWSLGVMFYRMINFNPAAGIQYPYKLREEKGYHNIVSRFADVTQQSDIAPSNSIFSHLDTIINRILRFEPEDRPTIDQIIVWLKALV